MHILHSYFLISAIYFLTEYLYLCSFIKLAPTLFLSLLIPPELVLFKFSKY